MSKELLPFCESDRQREVLECVIKTGSNTRAAAELKCCRRSIDRIMQRIKRNAEKHGLLDEHKKNGTVPEGFYAETSVMRKLNPETGKMEVYMDWTKSRLDKELQKQAYIAFIEGLGEHIKPAKPTKQLRSKYADDMATAIVFGDPHIGMLAHAVETLAEDYDLAKSIADLKASIDYCVDIAPPSAEGWFINVGDLTHANDVSHATPGHGHSMDMAARHNQTLRATGTFIRYAIGKMLTKFKTVKIINARGNHDRDAAFAANFYLEGVFEKEPRVEVFGNDSKFNFIEYGNSLFMINHGDGINDNRLAGTMTRLAGQAWGRTKYHRILTGHIHHKTRREHDSGAVIESFPILPPIDAYHADHGYGAERGVTMFNIHKEFGPFDRCEFPIEMIRAIAALKE